MRNLAMLSVLAAATVGFWGCFNLLFYSLLFPIGVSYRAFFGFVTVPDSLRILVFAGWAFFIARTSLGMFSGPWTQLLRILSAGFVVLVYLHAVGVFIPANFGSEFLLVQLGSALLVAFAGWAGLRAGSSARAFDKAASANLTPTEPDSDQTTPP